MKLRSPAAWRNPQSVPLEPTPGLRINKVFVAKGPAEPTVGSAEPTIGSYGTDPKPGEKGGFGLYRLRGTDNRFQRNRSVLRRVKRLGPIWAPTPGLIYITKFKPGEAQARETKSPAAACKPLSRILKRGRGLVEPMKTWAGSRRAKRAPLLEWSIPFEPAPCQDK